MLCLLAPRLGAAGLAVLLVLGRDEPDRPLGRIGRGGEFTHGIEQLAQLQPGVAAEGIVGELQRFRLHLQLGQLESPGDAYTGNQQQRSDKLDGCR